MIYQWSRKISKKKFHCTTIIYNYQKKLKHFIWKITDDKTVQAFDVLVPGIGELIVTN